MQPLRRFRATVPARIAGAPYHLGTRHVALTFDDGPHPRFTNEVLDLLAVHGVPATFFLVGRNASRHPEVVARIVAEGHAVASHSMTHPVPWALPRPALLRDYRDGRNAVSDVAGRDVRLFRPPKGYYDLRGGARARVDRSQPYLWSVDAADWEPGLTGEVIAERLGDPSPGDIVLLHDAIEGPWAPDCLDRSAMVRGLGLFLRRARDVGTSFVALDHR